ncbi:hypothetical protein [Lacimonas salitolerans]|uniref:Uncharacterized protein n=1 Tax=Lacimonas salitolerans TaxID=1323750 RepID=A0ABW4EEM3_9RHOB
MFRHFAVALTIAVASPAGAFVAENHHRVNALSGGTTFEVIGRAGSGPADYFCAASHYAQAVVGAPVAARVSVQRAYGPSQTAPGARAVSFTVDDGSGRRPGQNRNYSLSVDEPGFNLSIGMARSFCDDDLPEWLW